MTLRTRKHQEGEVLRHPREEKEAAPPHEDESNWLVSYADMMTLLCGFFIMLFSMSKLDNPQYDSFKESMSKQFGGNYVSPTKEMAKFASQIVQELGIQSSTVIKYDSNGISVAFESTLFFETLSSNVSEEGKKILERIITSISEQQKSNQKKYRIVIEGHTDGRPILGGVYPSNWELSGARASRVVRMFLEKGFAPDHLTAIGYADTHPQIEARLPNGQWDDKALAKNRRVVLRILEPIVEAIPFPDRASRTNLTTVPIPVSSSNPSLNQTRFSTPTSNPSLTPANLSAFTTQRN